MTIGKRTELRRRGDNIVTLGDGFQLDSFGRLRTSEVLSLVSYTQNYDDQSAITDEETNGGGSVVYDQSTASSVFSVPASAGAFAIQQTYEWYGYQAYKSQQAAWTLSGMQPQAGVEKRFGLFHSSTVSPFSASYDGIFFEVLESGISIITSRNGTETSRTAQANWFDPMQAVTDPSGNVLDLTYAQIFGLDYEWLGVGRARTSVTIDGIAKLLDTVSFANDGVSTTPYMQTGTQPLRWEIRSTGGAGSFRQICAAVGTEGAQNRPPGIWAADTGTTPIVATTAGNEYAILGIRTQSNKAAAIVDLVRFGVLATSNPNYIARIRLNPTVAGTFTYSDHSNSAMQVAVGGSTNTVTGGRPLAAEPGASQVGGKISVERALRFGSSIAGVHDAVVLTIEGVNNNLGVLASATWQQI
jgi:hypothetical protein